MLVNFRRTAFGLLKPLNSSKLKPLKSSKVFWAKWISFNKLFLTPLSFYQLSFFSTSKLPNEEKEQIHEENAFLKDSQNLVKAGFVCWQNNELSKSLQYFKKAKDLEQKIQNPNFSILSKIYYGMAQCHLSREQFNEAENCVDMSLEMEFKSNENGSNKGLIRKYMIKGQCFEEKGILQMAIKCYQKSIELINSNFSQLEGSENQKQKEISQVQFMIGDSYAKLDNWSKAKVYYLKAKNFYQAHLKEDCFFLSVIYLKIADCQFSLKNNSQAKKYYGESNSQLEILIFKNQESKQELEEIKKTQKYVNQMIQKCHSNNLN